MTHETPYNQAFAVSLASSPKHVVLKFFPLIMFPLLQVTVQTCYFLSLTLGMVLSPPYTFPSGLSYPGESSCPFLIIPWEQLFSQSGCTLRTTLIQSSLFAIIWICHHRITLFDLFLFYFCRITYNCFCFLCLGLLKAQDFTRSFTPKLLVPGF